MWKFLVGSLVLLTACAPAVVIRGPNGTRRIYPQDMAILVVNKCSDNGIIIDPRLDSIAAVPRDARVSVFIKPGHMENGEVKLTFDGYGEEGDYEIITERFRIPSMERSKTFVWTISRSSFNSSRRPIRCRSEVR